MVTPQRGGNAKKSDFSYYTKSRCAASVAGPPTKARMTVNTVIKKARDEIKSNQTVDSNFLLYDFFLRPDRLGKILGVSGGRVHFSLSAESFFAPRSPGENLVKSGDSRKKPKIWPNSPFLKK